MERAVQTAHECYKHCQKDPGKRLSPCQRWKEQFRLPKKIAKKPEDPYLAFLSYRSTPPENGYTPTELLLMGRKIRCTLSMSPEKLIPKLPNLKRLQKTECKKRLQQTDNYNIRHRASVLPDLNMGDKVWIPDNKTLEVVVRRSQAPRSVVVNTENSLLRRNKRDLVPSPRANAEGTSNTQLEGISLAQKYA